MAYSETSSQQRFCGMMMRGKRYLVRNRRANDSGKVRTRKICSRVNPMESLVAKRQATLIQVDPSTGLLVFQDEPYELTIEQIYAEFVENAPFREERELLFDAFKIYLKQTSSIIPNRKVWVDGSFVTHVKDRPPSDIDLLSVVTGGTPGQRRELARRGLVTMSEVTAKIASKDTPVFPKFAPYGGLIDAYYVDA